MTQRLERRVSLALFGVAGAGLFGFLWRWPPVDEASEVAQKGCLCVAVLALLWAARLAPLRTRPRGVLALYALCAVVAVAAHYNFGRFHFPQFVHYWEQFHYQLGARYFPELGYDGLYMASIRAEREIRPRRGIQRKVRDLRTNRVRLYTKIEAHADEVRARFTPERWKSFVADHRHFVRVVQPADLQAMRRDHGYNPTPAWTFVARLIQGDARFTAATLRRLAAIDSLLLAVAFAALFRCYGMRTGCLCLVIFGLGYAGRFQWVGGAYLRFDWLAAVTLALCALKRGRAVTAGALFGYAAAARLFPAGFLFGPAVVALAARWRGERPTWPLRLAAGFAAAVVVSLALGSTTGRGPAAWTEFARRMQVYQLSLARNELGLEWLVLYGGETLEHAVANLDEDVYWQLQREDVLRRSRDRRFLLRAFQALLLLLLGAAAWRAPPDRAAVLSLAAIFAVTMSAGYYWTMLLLVPLALPWPAVAALLALNALMYGVHALEGDGLIRYGLFSWGLAIWLVACLLPEALRTLRAARVRPAATG